RPARDDRVVCVAVIAETAAARRRFVFANGARSEWKIAAGCAQQRPKIPDLDAAPENFAGPDRRDAALRRQILFEASGRESDRARSLRNQSRAFPSRDRRRIDDHYAARATAVSSSHPDALGKARTNPARSR